MSTSLQDIRNRINAGFKDVQNPAGQLLQPILPARRENRRTDDATSATTLPDLPIQTPEDFVRAERLYARQLRLPNGYVAAAAQPTYGYMAWPTVQSGRIQEVLFLSISGIDPFSTVAQTQTPYTTSVVSGAGNTPLTAPSGNSATTTAYVTGFEVTGTGATAASTILVTLTGTISGPLNYSLGIPAGVNTSITPLIIPFAQPVPASALNTPIQLNVPAFGAGNVANGAAATLHGYLQGNASAFAGQAIGFISSYVPQDSNVEPPFPNVVLAPTSLPIINAPTRRQILMWPGERFIVAFKGLANGAQISASIAVIEYELSSFIKALAP